MYSSSKHKELVSGISAVQGSVDQAAYKEELHSDKMVKKLLDIDDHLVTLIGLLQEVKDSNKSTTQSKPLQYVGTIKGKPLQGVGTVKARPWQVSVQEAVEDAEEDQQENQQEDYKSPEKPVYKHLYYYDVENINDGSHSKYSRLSDIAADVGASDSAPHYAMVNGTLFLGKYLINKVDTKVKVSVNPRQEDEKASIEIV